MQFNVTFVASRFWETKIRKDRKSVTMTTLRAILSAPLTGIAISSEQSIIRSPCSSTTSAGTTRTLSSMSSQTFRTENSKSSLSTLKNTFKLNGGRTSCFATRSSFYRLHLTLSPSHWHSPGGIISSICTRQFETLFRM